MLEVRDLHAFYGKSHVLHGLRPVGNKLPGLGDLLLGAGLHVHLGGQLLDRRAQVLPGLLDFRAQLLRFVGHLGGRHRCALSLISATSVLTLSTASVETFTLIDQQHVVLAAAYCLGTLGAALVAVTAVDRLTTIADQASARAAGWDE